MDCEIAGIVNPNAELSLKLTAGPVPKPVAWAGWVGLVALGLVLAAALKITRKPTLVSKEIASTTRLNKVKRLICRISP